MSQEYHQQAGIFSFSNGFERSQRQPQIAVQQIRRDKPRVQGFEPPSPLVAIEEDESSGLPGYETVGMLSEMFNFQPSGTAATELLENQIQVNYRASRQIPAAVAAGGSNDWYGGGRQGTVVGGLGHSSDSKDDNFVNGRDSVAAATAQISSINGDSAAAMQLFLANPPPKSPSPSPTHHHHHHPPSTFHMLLPHPPPSSTSFLHHHQGFQIGAASPAAPTGAAFGTSQFTWLPDHGPTQISNPAEIGGMVEGQGLSLSLSSTLQHIEAAKAEELRIGEGGMLFFNQGGGAATNSVHYQYKNLLQQGGLVQNGQLHVGCGSSVGVVNLLRNSRYSKAAQELLEEFCSVGRGHFKRGIRLGKNSANPNNSNPSGSGGGATSSSSSKDLPPLSASDRLEHQRRKVKLLAMLDEVERRYSHYSEQMQMVVNSFDVVMGFGAATPYTALARKAMSRHFRCLKDAIAGQLKQSCEVLGEKDATAGGAAAGAAGVTKGETPRLKMLEQSLRQQRAFQQMGMMEQDAWRPQRGLPERSVNILRAWLFEHFLHPYPSDADKHLLARQTGLSRNQVSNWFINARVRLWKPMIEEMYEQEIKEDGAEDGEKSQEDSGHSAQASTPPNAVNNTITTTTTITAASASVSASASAAKRSQINASSESDPSLIAINADSISENQANHLLLSSAMPLTAASFPDVCHRVGGIAGRDFGAPAASNSDMGSTLIRYGAITGDVSLTLGLRHAGNLPEKSHFSVRDFGGC